MKLCGDRWELVIPEFLILKFDNTNNFIMKPLVNSLFIKPDLHLILQFANIKEPSS